MLYRQMEKGDVRMLSGKNKKILNKTFLRERLKVNA